MEKRISVWLHKKILKTAHYLLMKHFFVVAVGFDNFFDSG
jgi:hypothetical protein